MRLLSVALVCSCVFSGLPVTAGQGLRVIVIDGDEAANIVAEKIAAEPVIEVRDREDRRVAGAIVRFTIRRSVGNRLRAVFGKGESEVRTLTDTVGRARAGALTPVEPGNYEIVVEVSHQGQTATTTIRHTNFATSAHAEAAGRKPGQSSGSSGAGAGASGATATAQGAAAAAGGGLSKLAIVGLAVGGAAGAGAAVVLSQKKSGDAPAGSVTGLAVSQSAGVQAATPFSFSVQATNFQAGAVRYRWEFGDGSTSSDPNPTHIYSSPGTYTVVVTVSDDRQSARSETSVTVYTVSGTWATPDGRTTFQLTQTGTSINGASSWDGGTGPDGTALPPYSCTASGSVQAGTPALIQLSQPPCPGPLPFIGTLAPLDLRLGMSNEGQTLSGDLIIRPGLPGQRTEGIVLRRQ
jgi:hypothetical protein